MRSNKFVTIYLKRFIKIKVLNVMLLLVLILPEITSCNGNNGLTGDNLRNKNFPKQTEVKTESASNSINRSVSIKDAKGMTIKDRFRLKGLRGHYLQRIRFKNILRKLPLKSDGTKVHYFDGRVKDKNDVYDAVVDIDTGKMDLQQCADAVMRLRAEYLYKQKRYNDIHFNFLNGFRADYKKWIDGYRVALEGNKAYWVKKAQSANTYKDFRGVHEHRICIC